MVSMAVEPPEPPTISTVELDNLQNADPPPPPRSGSTRLTAKQLLSLLALFATLFIASLNTTIVATAIPTIVHEFDSPSGYAWITAAFLVASTAASPIWAKLSDIWGRKKILILAVAAYACTSLICALATSVEMLIAGRALQGVTGGGLIQLVTIVISDMFSMRHRGMYLGLTEIVWTIAAGAGPVMGGAFAQHQSLTWRWIFWIVLPICFVAFLLLAFALDVHNPRTPLAKGLKAIDWAGSVTLVGMLVMLLLGLNFGGATYAWDSPTVICLIVFGLSLTGVFVYCEKKISRYPLIPLTIFMDRSNLAVLLVAFIKHFGLITLDFYLPLFFQSVRDASPVQSGYLILPADVTVCISGIICGFLMTKTGRYLELLRGGTALMTLGWGLITIWTPSSSIGLIIGLQFILGWSNGMLISSCYIALQANVPPSMTAASVATLALAKNIGAAMSVVVGQTVFQNGMSQRNAGLVAAGVPTNITALLDGQTAAANLDVMNTITDPVILYLVQDAFAGALRNIWILNSGLSAAATLASLFIRHKTLSDQHVETKTGLEKDPATEVHTAKEHA